MNGYSEWTARQRARSLAQITTYEIRPHCKIVTLTLQFGAVRPRRQSKSMSGNER